MNQSVEKTEQCNSHCYVISEQQAECCNCGQKVRALTLSEYIKVLELHKNEQ